jgi:hypothetical protein
VRREDMCLLATATAMPGSQLRHEEAKSGTDVAIVIV